MPKLGFLAKGFWPFKGTTYHSENIGCYGFWLVILFLKTERQIYVDFVHVNNVCFEVIRPWFQKLEISAIRAILAS